jgi:hypothetical protein
LEHVGVTHGKLGRFLPLAVWNNIKYHHLDARQDEAGAAPTSAAAAANTSVADAKPLASMMSPPTLPPAAISSPRSVKKLSPPRHSSGSSTGESPDTNYTCYICQRVFSKISRIRQHYVVSHFMRQFLDRFTVARKVTSVERERCFFCPHMSLPRHMPEHVRYGLVNGFIDFHAKLAH